MDTIKVISGLFLVTVALIGGFVQPARASPAESDVLVLAQGNNAFALQLYLTLRTHEGNLFYSPYSISAALAMIYAGSEGATKSQMKNALHFGLTGDRLSKAYSTINQGLLREDKKLGYEFISANAAWIMKGLIVREDYHKRIKADYKAQIIDADFALDSASARRSINTWVERQTRGKIKDLVGEGILTPNTRLVLTNAIYFHGLWTSRFNKEKTRAAPFTMLNGEKITAPMMWQNGAFNYVESGDFKALELPYKGSVLSLVVFLPARHDGLTKVEESLTAENVDKWLNQMTKKEVHVELPKFKMCSKMDLSEVLKTIGLTNLFSVPPADLSGIDGKKDLFVSALLHEAAVDINEKGTEAAAATAGTLSTTSLKLPVEFKADHPFVFLIRQTKPCNIIFLGRLVNPVK